MRILDEQDNEIQESDVDTSLGYLKDEQIYTDTTPAKEEVPEKFHYVVKTWYFTDGTSKEVGDNSDPTVKVVDDQTGIFQYVDQGDGKEYHGADVEKIIDQKHEPAVAEHKNYETVQRYILYTEEELAAKKAEKEKAQKQADFLENGPDQLATNTSSIDDLTIMISELVGTEETE